MRADKSIVVQGKSIEDALEQASQKLQSPTADLAYDVLQHGLVDPQGDLRISYELRVLSIVSAPPGSDEREHETHPLRPPFSREELESWSSAEFLTRLETEVANQPDGVEVFHTASPDCGRQVLEINGDVAQTHDVLIHDGDIHIRGTVRTGSNVRATGSIAVLGDVEVAQLHAGRDIIVDGGILGIALAPCGNIRCRHAQGAYIKCSDLLEILDDSIHSILESNDRIAVGGAIIGGTCTAPLSIIAKETGSDRGVVTKLYSGKNHKVREEAEAVRRLASRLVRRLSESTRDIKQFSQKEFVDTKGTVEERMKLWAAMSEKVWINDRLMQLSRRKNALLASIDQDRTARIRVAEKVYPQTQIEIDDVGMTVKNTVEFVTFSKDYEAGVMRMTSYC